MLVYVDTNVYIDMIQSRENPNRPLNDFAFYFFADGWNCKFKLIISQHLINELKRHVKEKEYEDIFDIFRKRDKLVFVKEEKEDREHARKIPNNNKNDVLHAVLANRAKADVLVTRNVLDYFACEELVPVLPPERV